MSRFCPPPPPRKEDVQAQRIARLDTLITAMDAALCTSNKLLFDLWMVTDAQEERDRIMAQRDENIELHGMARFYQGEGRSL